MSKKYFVAMSILATTAFFGCQPAETPVAEEDIEVTPVEPQEETTEGLTKSREEGNNVYYDGEITVSGTYSESLSLESFANGTIWFDVEGETTKLIPRDPNHWGPGQADKRNPYFSFANQEEALTAFEIDDAKTLEGKCIEGKATVKITDYKVPKIEGDAWDTAKLVEVVSKEPYEIVDCQ